MEGETHAGSRMSESEVICDEEGELSPDLFSDVESSMSSTVNNDAAISNSSSMSTEPEPSDDIPEWKGMSMSEIRRGLGVYERQEHPPVTASSRHTVLFTLPLSVHGPPKPYPTHGIDKWSQGYVRMPHSRHSLYPIEQRNGSRYCRNRWEMIQEALLRNILSSQQLEDAILSYNQIYAQRWNFAALGHFFSEVLDSEETIIFFRTLMPKMVQLALQLPAMLTGAIPLLKRHTNGSISLSQLQVASLLANAFFCTFPRRNSSNPQSEYATYPHINFNRLFAAYSKEKQDRCATVTEKMKCLFHYFRRVTSKAPEGVITIERRYIPLENCPKWHSQNRKLPSLHITSKGTIEDEGAGLLQVDFANKYVGGGVLGLGCVQEEIRFVICPELMVTMLVTEELDNTEALVVSGVERYSKYEGYNSTFKWKGDFVDETPRDDSGRRKTSIVAIDALYFKQPLLQFNAGNITRELNKAYVGFVGSDINKDNLPAIATGNWGCGAFRGNPRLKVLIQLMAAAATGRSMIYFTFGDTNLRDDIAMIYAHLLQHDIDIARIYSMLLEYYSESTSSAQADLYHFLRNRSSIRPLDESFPIKAESSSAKTFAKCSKNMLFGDDEMTSASSKSERYLCSKGGKITKEGKIFNWLMNCDDENVQHDAKNLCNEETTNTARETNNSEKKELRKNCLVDNDEENKKLHLAETKMENKTSDESVANLSSSKDPIVELAREKESKRIKSESRDNEETNDGRCIKILEGVPPSESCKPKLCSKRSGQRKIVEFFHRTL